MSGFEAFRPSTGDCFVILREFLVFCVQLIPCAACWFVLFFQGFNLHGTYFEFRSSNQFEPISGVKAAGLDIINGDCFSKSRYLFFMVFRPSNFGWFLITSSYSVFKSVSGINFKAIVASFRFPVVGDALAITILVSLLHFLSQFPYKSPFSVCAVSIVWFEFVPKYLSF